MPGHWLLARLGKRVLRPGGLSMTRGLLNSLAIGPADDVIEFAPGLGFTAGPILKRQPRHYIGVERDVSALQWMPRHLPGQDDVTVVLGAVPLTNRACRTIPLAAQARALWH